MDFAPRPTPEPTIDEGLPPIRAARPTTPLATTPPIPTATPTPTPKPASTPTPTSTPKPEPSSSPKSKVSPGAPAPTPTRATTPIDTAAVAAKVLTMVNDARASAGVHPLVMDRRLVASAAAHNAAMSIGCGLAHRCPGEAALDVRVRAQGMNAQWYGENVGTGGPVALTTQAAWSMARRLTSNMLAEQPPNDGHRRNILDRDFRFIGIAVAVDQHGVVWLTQDFAG